MRAIEHPFVNVRYAEDQEEYQTLPCFRTKDGQIIAAFRLDEEEMEQIKKTGVIYLKVHTFNKPLQPIGMNLLNPFPPDQKTLDCSCGNIELDPGYPIEVEGKLVAHCRHCFMEKGPEDDEMRKAMVMQKEIGKAQRQGYRRIPEDHKVPTKGFEYISFGEISLYREEQKEEEE